jgi:SAM-dependent methyltransferase
LLDNPFNRSGLASLDDLSTTQWHSLFPHLESIQNEFIAAQPHTSDYPWTRDPLHNCIRAWEYPFVYHHLRSHRCSESTRSSPRIVDLGSGATFFPFAVAQLGCSVVAVDADTRAKASVDRAIGAVSTGAGTVTSLLSDARSITLESESVDAVFCISVLEHIPDFQAVIAEVGRILRNRGLFVLTFDVDLRGNFQLGPASYTRLIDTLDASFSLVYPEKVVHPLRVLTTDNSIYPLYRHRSILEPLIAPLWRPLSSGYNRLRGRHLPPGCEMPPGRVLATTYGACLRKRDSPR